MIKRFVVRRYDRKTYLEYDENEYDIEYSSGIDKFIIRSKKTNQVRLILDDNIGFIIQNKDEQNGISNFMVSSTNRKEENSTSLCHYIDYETQDKMIKKYTLPISSINEKDIRIGTNVYVTDTYHDKKLKRLYNQNRTSKVFDEVYYSPRLTERVEKIIGKNIIMVREDKKANGRITDSLIYGIDPQTFEAVTPIWSDFKQDFVDPKEDETKYIEEANSMYKDKDSKELNLEFVRKFKNKKDEE